MRIGIIAIHHESNTFLPQPTTIENFRADTLATGEKIRGLFATAHHEIGGFFEGVEREKMVTVPIFAARAIPSGTISAQTSQTLIGQMHGEIDRAGELDGLLVAAHGA